MSGKRPSGLLIHQLRLLPFGGSELVVAKPKRTRSAPRSGCNALCSLMQGEVGRFVRQWAGVPSPTLVADEVTRLSAGTFEELKRLGLLVPGGTAKAVGCEACDLGHAEWVEAIPVRDGEAFFIECPEKGRVEVSVQRLQHWAVDFTPLARAIKAGLSASGQVEALQRGRLWRLGRAVLAGRPRELWMAREAPAARGGELGRSIPNGAGSAIFLLNWPPSEELLALGAAALFDVHKVVHLGGAGFHVDRHAVERSLRAQSAADSAAEAQLLCCCG
jgi:hypothetical protein